jgi:hypothetical protein
LLESILGIGEIPKQQPLLAQLRYIFEPEYLQELRYSTFGLLKTDYILLSLHELLVGNEDEFPMIMWNRLFRLQIRIQEFKDDIDLSQCFLILERSITRLKPYSSWATLIPTKERVDMLVDSSQLVLESLSNRNWNVRTEIVLLNIAGFMAYFAGTVVLEPFISKIRLNITKSQQSEEMWILKSLSMHLCVVFMQDFSVFETYPDFYAEVMRGERNYLFSDAMLVTKSLIHGTINEIAKTFLTSEYTSWIEFTFVWIHHIGLLDDRIGDVLLIMLDSTAWRAMRTEAILFLAVLLKENWTGIFDHEDTHLKLLDKILDIFLDRIVASPVMDMLFCHMRNHTNHNNRLLIECISGRIGIPTVDERLIFELLTETITPNEYSEAVHVRLQELTFRRIAHEDIQDFGKYLNSLFQIKSVADVVTEYFYDNWHQHKVYELVRYLLVSTSYETVFGYLVDKFTNTVSERIQANAVLEDLIVMISDLFKGTLINDRFVDALVRMDFIGVMTRLVNKLPPKNSTPTFSSFVNLLGKVISYDYRLVHEFVDSDGYSTVFSYYIEQKDMMEPNSFFTPLLFSWRGDYFHILHHASLEFLFQAINFMDPPSFVSVFSLVLANCSMLNLWNMEQCRNAKMFQLIIHRLDYFDQCNILDQCRKFLVTLLCYHTEFEDVKLLMSILAGKEKIPLSQDAILDMMQRICNHPISNSPNDFFVLKGPESHFEIPIFPKSCLNTGGYAFVLWFHLTNPNFVLAELSWSNPTCNLRIVVQDTRLVILFVENNIQSEIMIKDTKLELNRWYSVLFNHKIGMFNISSETLHLDGQLLWKGNVFRSQPQSDLQFEVAKQASNIHSISISSFAFFNQAISPETLQNLQFTKETSLPISVELYQFQLLPTSLQPILFCHPMAVVRDEFCYNLSSNSVVVPRITLEKIHAVKTRSFGDALQSIGSVEILYPLLTVPQGDSILGLSNVVNDQTQNRSFILVIKLLSALVCNSPYHRSKFMHSKGPKLLSLLLQQIPVDYVSLDLLDTILDFRTSASMHAGLAEMLDEHLICEPQIWSRSEPNIQREYFSRILDLYRDLKKHNVTHWLDSIEQFYGGISKTSGSWGFIQTILSYSLSGEEIERFSESLWCCIHSPEGPTLYDIFEHMYIVNTAFYEAILDYNGVELILRMCQSIHESVRNHALKICSRVLSDSEFYGVALENDILGVDEMMWTSIFSSQPFSRTTYTLLMCLALGSTVPESMGSVLDFENRDIKHPIFLKVIMELLVAGIGDISLFCRVLEDLNYLVGEGVRNTIHLKTFGLSCYLLRCLQGYNVEFDSKKELFQQSAVLMTETLFHSENPCLVSSVGFIEAVSLIFFSLSPSNVSKFIELLLDTVLERLNLVLTLEPNHESQVILLN